MPGNSIDVNVHFPPLKQEINNGRYCVFNHFNVSITTTHHSHSPSILNNNNQPPSPRTKTPTPPVIRIPLVFNSIWELLQWPETSYPHPSSRPSLPSRPPENNRFGVLGYECRYVDNGRIALGNHVLFYWPIMNVEWSRQNMFPGYSTRPRPIHVPTDAELAWVGVDILIPPV